MILVKLTDEERSQCAVWGAERYAASTFGGDRDIAAVKRSEDEKLHVDVLGVYGEYAFCKALGVPYEFTINTYKAEPDVAPDWEIRTPKPKNRNGSLIIHCDNDVLTRRFALVTTPNYRHFELRGWIRGSDVRDEWIKNPGGHRPAWFVPQDVLNPFGFES
jgi:hypothetical protein